MCVWWLERGRGDRNVLISSHKHHVGGVKWYCDWCHVIYAPLRVFLKNENKLDEMVDI